MKIAYCPKCGNRFDVEGIDDFLGTWGCPNCGWDDCYEVIPSHYRGKHHLFTGADKYDRL